MASDGKRCGVIGSFLTMSCRGRAEAFAKTLHSKLSSLGSHDDSSDESSWLTANEKPTTLSQPAHSSNDTFLDLESPGSPEEEVQYNNLINEDTLQKNSIESDIYYDTETNGIDDTENTINEDDSMWSIKDICDNTTTTSTTNAEEEETEEKAPRVRRSTSLKTGKTPPGTPGQKKIVRFADALGLDLADVRTFLDDVPKIPHSAFDDLTNADLTEYSNKVQLKATKYLMPMFQQPGGMPNFLDIVREYNVCLENIYVEDPFLLSIKGTVRVRNLDFHKSVHIRYTLDSWKNYADVQATYVENSCDGFSDKFSFLLYAHTLTIGQRLELACRFQCRGCQYWDNNKGANYCFQCLPTTNTNTSHSIDIPDDWGGASFY